MPDKAATINAWVTYTAGAGLVVGGVTVSLNDVAMVFGMVLGAATFLMSWHFQRKRIALTEEAVKYERDRRESDRGV